MHRQLRQCCRPGRIVRRHQGVECAWWTPLRSDQRHRCPSLQEMLRRLRLARTRDWLCPRWSKRCLGGVGRLLQAVSWKYCQYVRRSAGVAIQAKAFSARCFLLLRVVCRKQHEDWLVYRYTTVRGAARVKSAALLVVARSSLQKMLGMYSMIRIYGGWLENATVRHEASVKCQVLFHCKKQLQYKSWFRARATFVGDRPYTLQ